MKRAISRCQFAKNPFSTDVCGKKKSSMWKYCKQHGLQTNTNPRPASRTAVNRVGIFVGKGEHASHGLRVIDTKTGRLISENKT